MCVEEREDGEHGECGLASDTVFHVRARSVGMLNVSYVEIHALDRHITGRFPSR